MDLSGVTKYVDLFGPEKSRLYFVTTKDLPCRRTAARKACQHKEDYTLDSMKCNEIYQDHYSRSNHILSQCSVDSFHGKIEPCHVTIKTTLCAPYGPLVLWP